MNDRMVLANNSGYLKSVFEKSDLPYNSHAGLVFSKFLNLWEGSPSNPTKKEAGKVLDAFVSAYNRRNSNISIPCKLLSEIHQRMARYEEKCHMKSITCQVGWRLAGGMGIPNPIGNGFDFDPIIGVPIINGTAIKGLCRYSAKIFDCDETTLTRLFGPETIIPGQTDPSTGDILFYDAFPVNWPKLGVDIINCHHSSYYTRMENDEQKKENNRLSETDSQVGFRNCSQSGNGEGKNWPRETESPVPVFFLTVENKTEFIFRISSRINSPKDMESAFDFLQQGLEYFGIGGKTSAGYGIMQYSSERNNLNRRN